MFHSGKGNIPVPTLEWDIRTVLDSSGPFHLQLFLVSRSLHYFYLGSKKQNKFSGLTGSKYVWGSSVGPLHQGLFQRPFAEPRAQLSTVPLLTPLSWLLLTSGTLGSFTTDTSISDPGIKSPIRRPLLWSLLLFTHNPREWMFGSTRGGPCIIMNLTAKSNRQPRPKENDPQAAFLFQDLHKGI